MLEPLKSRPGLIDVIIRAFAKSPEQLERARELFSNILEKNMGLKLAAIKSGLSGDDAAVLHERAERMLPHLSSSPSPQPI